jgi:O-6-methylguanine DNA methyltransferase
MTARRPARRPPGSSPFARRVLRLLRQIPPGRVTTYGDLARFAGRPGAARAVGNIMRLASEPGLPYYRVIAAGGRVGHYGCNPELKRQLLRAEGIPIRRDRVVGFKTLAWRQRD